LIGIIFFLCFILLGFGISNRIFHKEQLHIQIWGGIILGVLSLMWLPAIFSFIFNFTILSNILALVSMIILYTVSTKFLKAGSIEYNFDKTQLVMLSTSVPILIIIFWLFTNHIITPLETGYFVGQSTYGDLAMHMGMITSISEQGTFPPSYSIFPSAMLSYPFLVNLMSSSLYIFNTSIRWSILLPSLFLATALVFGFFIFSIEIIKNKMGAAISSILFFFNGGLGFIYFMDKLRTDKDNFFRIFDGFYTTPTNFNENNIRWSNTICDMIIPQRTTLVGWTMLVFVLWLVYKGIQSKNKHYLLISGIISGLMPMIHTHSYLAIGLVVFTWILAYIEKNNITPYFKKWLYFLIPAGVLSIPQLLYWIFPHTSGDSFLKIQSGGWEANIFDNPIWFWTKNIGIVFILLVPALFSAKKHLYSFYSGAVVIFIIANIVLFQPNNYDNNKLLYIWYAFSIIVVVSFMIQIFEHMKGIRFRVLPFIILIFLGTFSGILTIGREFKSGNQYQLFSKAHVEAAEFIKENTLPSSVFLTSPNHNNSVAAITGRNIYCGANTFLFYHGFDTTSEYDAINQMFTDSSKFPALSTTNNIDYVFYGDYERGKYTIDINFFTKNYPTVFDNGVIKIFAISKSAKDFAIN
jgi:hypothetical protein